QDTTFDEQRWNQVLDEIEAHIVSTRKGLVQACYDAVMSFLGTSTAVKVKDFLSTQNLPFMNKICDYKTQVDFLVQFDYLLHFENDGPEDYDDELDELVPASKFPYCCGHSTEFVVSTRRIGFVLI
ncbi:hypothetical protein JCM5350_005349, partial [Sporobolomyces pararoseus]